MFSMFFLSKSTFTTGSGFSNPVCPVSVSFLSPFSITIALLTHFNNDKSKYCTFKYSLSISSSFGLLLFGVESISSTGFPSSSLSSVISAVFIIILFVAKFVSVTLNAICTSL